jgi:hypothetical protein
MNPADLFRRLSTILSRANIPYILTGSFAATVYGLGRGSQDVDFIIAADEAQIKTLLSLLPVNGFYSEPNAALEACRRSSMFNLIDNITGLKIDFIFRKMRPFSQEEFKRCRTAPVLGVTLSIASPEDLIIAKLEWAKMGASCRQIEDVTGILKVRGDELDHPYLEHWIDQLGLSEQWASARKASGRG